MEFASVKNSGLKTMLMFLNSLLSSSHVPGGTVDFITMMGFFSLRLVSLRSEERLLIFSRDDFTIERSHSPDFFIGVGKH